MKGCWIEDSPMTFTFDKNGPVIVMTCVGSLDVDHAQTLKDALLVGIENSDNLVVNCERVDSVDSQCVEIFCTAHRMAVRIGKKLIITGIAPEFAPSPQEISNICLSRSAIGCNRSCIWIPTVGRTEPPIPRKAFGRQSPQQVR